MISAFGQALQKHLDTAGLSQRAFARLVGVSPANMNKIIAGIHEAPCPPVEDELVPWCDALGLNDADRKLLLDLAAIAQLPEKVRPKFEAWYFEHEDLKQTVEAQQRALDILEQEARDRAAAIQSAR